MVMTRRLWKSAKIAAAALLILGLAGWLAYEVLPDKSPTRNLAIQAGPVDSVVFDFASRGLLQAGTPSTGHWGVRLLSIQIWELDAEGNRSKCMWDIKVSSSGDPEINTIEYGHVPDGWTENQKALPLETGRCYLLRDRIFFKDSTGKYNVVPGFFHREQIAEQVRKMNNQGASRQ